MQWGTKGRTDGWIWWEPTNEPNTIHVCRQDVFRRLGYLNFECDNAAAGRDNFWEFPNNNNICTEGWRPDFNPPKTSDKMCTWTFGNQLAQLSWFGTPIFGVDGCFYGLPTQPVIHLSRLLSESTDHPVPDAVLFQPNICAAGRMQIITVYVNQQQPRRRKWLIIADCLGRSLLITLITDQSLVSIAGANVSYSFPLQRKATEWRFGEVNTGIRMRIRQSICADLFPESEMERLTQKHPALRITNQMQATGLINNSIQCLTHIGN